jgi:hypothetical protein
MHFVGIKSRETIFGSSFQASAERAAAASNEADRLACEARNQRMLGYRRPAQQPPTLGQCWLCLTRNSRTRWRP